MKYEIRELEAFSVIGQEIQLTGYRTKNIQISTQFWRTFNANLKKAYLSQSGTWLKYAFMERKNGGLTYFCAIPKRTIIPDGFILKEIQPHQYLVAEHTGAMNRIYDTYILMPPYLYGQMNNVYREAFVFDCAMADRKFYLPRDGKMKLQFFHVHDLSRFTEILLNTKPSQHIYNVGNKETVTIREWVHLCYRTAGRQAEFINVRAPRLL